MSSFVRRRRLQVPAKEANEVPANCIPRPSPPTLRVVEGGRPLEEIHLRLFARRVFQDVDQLGMRLLESHHIVSERGIAVRVGHLRTQVLPDALCRQPLAKTGLNLFPVRLGSTRWSVCSVRAGRQVGRMWNAVVARSVAARESGAGGQVGRFWLPPWGR